MNKRSRRVEKAILDPPQVSNEFNLTHSVTKRLEVIAWTMRESCTLARCRCQGTLELSNLELPEILACERRSKRMETGHAPDSPK